MVHTGRYNVVLAIFGICGYQKGNFNEYIIETGQGIYFENEPYSRQSKETTEV